MITKVFAIYDHKALNYGVPFFMATPGMAIRAFGDLVKDQQSMISKHPKDFALFQIGEFDDSSGVLKSVSPAVQMAQASEFEPKPVASSAGGAVLSEPLHIPGMEGKFNGGER